MPRKIVFRLRLVSCALFITLLIFGPIHPLVVQAAYPASPIVIGEIAWAGSSLSDADEWLELWNVSDAPQPLGGWSLRGAGESGKTIFLPADAIIAAHAAYLVANYDSANAKSDLDIMPQAATTTVSLSNSNLKIELIDSLGQTVDTAGSGASPLAGSSSPTKISMLRRDATLDGSSKEAWMDSATKQYLKPNVNDLATPGVCDNCLPPSSTAEIPSEPGQDTAAATSSTEAISTSTLDIVLQEAVSSTEISTDTSSPTADQSTSTEAITAATSTQNLLEDTGATTTDQAAVSTIAAADAIPQTQDVTLATSSSASQTTNAASKPVYAMLRLNEISPYPASGKEWVELTTLDASNAIQLKGCELHDRQGRILTLGSHVIDPTSNRFIKIELPTARLNNDGDAVSLYDPNGLLLDTIAFPALHKGQTWIRYPDLSGGWQKSDLPTPGTANVPSQTAAVAQPTKTVTSSSQNSITVTASSTAQPSSSAITPASTPSADSDWINGLMSEDAQNESMAGLIASLESDAKGPTVRTNAVPVAKKSTKKQTTKKTSASQTKTEPIIPFTFAMLNQIEDTPLRVRLEGAVGSTSGLLPNHSFVLQSPEGRGLLVKVPTSRRLPGFGNDITVIGKLYVDDHGAPYLKMAAKDLLEIHGSSTQAVPRLVDLTAPSIEDAWAFMSVTGTVVSVKNRTISLDLGDASLDVIVRQNVKYRPQRLVAGDQVNISGLLDTGHDQPQLLPRTPADIVLIKHAALAAATQPAKTTGLNVPGWTPLGAAAGAIAVTEGAKQLHRRRRQRRLETKLAELTKTAG